MQQRASSELPLDYILELDRSPTIGEINRAINHEVWRLRNDPNKSDLLDHAWGRCDNAFWHRADYLVWRSFFRRDHWHGRRRRLEPNELLTQAENWLDNPDETVVWGLLAVLAGLIAYSQSMPLPKEDRVALANPCEARLFKSLKPLPRGETGCAAIAVGIVDASQKARYQLYKTMGGGATCTAIKEYLDRLERWLRGINREWNPGAALRLDAYEEEVMNGHSIVVAPFTPRERALRLIPAMYNAHQAVRTVVTDISRETEALLDRAFLLALSAWQTARLLRIREQRRQALDSSRRPNHDLEKLWAYEMQALYNATGAARDAGRFLVGASLAHMLLRLVPDSLASKEEYQKWGDNSAYSIRQTGLQVDERFVRVNRQNANASPARPDNPSATGWGGSPAFQARITKDQGEPLWQPILKHYGSRPKYLRRVLEDARSGTPIDVETVSSAYHLYLRYGMIEDAAAILEFFNPTKWELFYFVHSINRALQVMPFGFNPETHEKWHNILRTRWSRFSGNVDFTRDEALAIHDLLLGRAASIVKYVPDGYRARAFARRYYDRRLNSAQIRQMYEEVPFLHRHGPATAIGSRVDGFLERISGSALGSPVFASVLGFGQQWGILTVGAKKRWEYRWFPSDGKGPHTPTEVARYATHLQRTCSNWLRNLEGSDRRLSIPWGEGLTGLAYVIKEAANEVNPQAQWLMLAIEPDLAGLPWNHLFSTMGAGLVVSVIPCLTWATQGDDDTGRDGAVNPLTYLSDEQPIGSSDLHNVIQSDAARWRRTSTSVACVLGHGEWSHEFTSIQVRGGRVLDLDDWLDLAMRRIVVVHSCFGGRVKAKFSGDLGGLPGPALAMGCRALFAPVTEVPVETAHILHQHLFQASGPRELGKRYLLALAQDPSVALYNIYGFANEVME